MIKKLIKKLFGKKIKIPGWKIDGIKPGLIYWNTRLAIECSKTIDRDIFNLYNSSFKI